jgi:bacteriocin-like protein
MERDMSKADDTTKTRELTEAELAAVSGGVVFTAVSNVLKMSHAPMKIEVGL